MLCVLGVLGIVPKASNSKVSDLGFFGIVIGWGARLRLGEDWVEEDWAAEDCSRGLVKEDWREDWTRGLVKEDWREDWREDCQGIGLMSMTRGTAIMKAYECAFWRP